MSKSISFRSSTTQSGFTWKNPSSKISENGRGKTGSELAEDDEFYEALISAPVEKHIRVVVIKEIKGSQYGVQLESAVRDRLAAVDKYEEEEEEALEKVAEFFQSKYLKPNSVITFHFSATPPAAEANIIRNRRERRSEDQGGERERRRDDTQVVSGRQQSRVSLHGQELGRKARGKSSSIELVILLFVQRP
ncbi:putative chalcone--flavonone isomerase 3 [Iris pallida]|uniref:Chalcone-flavonone isomerase family protein n=1 Tax=Iris pallida TaxID=29817 RepID=A0AAX6EQW2_IRIPA|nr:putative chalcone--flavonone isomerase 3 [Iris pallida]